MKPPKDSKRSKTTRGRKSGSRKPSSVKTSGESKVSEPKSASKHAY